MLRYRKALLALIILLGGGSFYYTLGYAVYLHSGSYHRSRERELSRFLQLPVAIGDVLPQSATQADFLDIHVWLPGKRAKVFHCDRAEMHWLPGEGEPFNLVLRDGALTIDDDRWSEDDYRTVLRSGLAHDFATLQLRWVDLFNMDLLWQKERMTLAVRDATGRVQFDSPDEGRISVVSHTLNETTTSEPINVVARFRPSRDLVVHEVVLRVPKLSVGALGLESLLEIPKARGEFEGRLQYTEREEKPHVVLEGRATGLHLEDWTVRSPTGIVHGMIDVQIDRAELNTKSLLSATFSGQARGLRLEELSRIAAVPPIQGRASFEVLHAEVADQRLVRASLCGEVADASLDPFTALIGPGKISGTLRLKVNGLHIVGEDVVSADIDVEVVPPEDQPGTIDTDLIIAASEKVMGIELSSLISATLKRLDKVTYTRFALKLLVDEGQLRILGTHGAGRRSILTVQVFGTELAILTQPRRPIELAPILTKLREAGQKKMQELIERYRPTTAPAGLEM